MTEHLQQFIDRRKREVDEERKKLLAKIPELQIREYSGLSICNEKYPLWDSIKNQSYKINAVVDVSEDDYEIMKKYLQQEDKVKAEVDGLLTPSDAADKTLSVLAVICLVLAFIGLIVGLAGLSDVGSYRWNPTTLISGIIAFVVFLIQWAALRLLVNISVRLRQINNNLNKSL